MKNRRYFTLNMGGRMLSLDTPVAMGILNATPDSFYESSRVKSERDISQRALDMVAEGAAILDVGGCSTRPGCEPAGEKEEMARLRRCLPVVRRACPDIPISVDTFRPDVARMCVEEYGVTMVNDVSGGSDEMFRMVARLRVPYVLMSIQPDVPSMLRTFGRQVDSLHEFGVADVVLDPGFGFGKTLDDNYRVLQQLEHLHVMDLPLLVGVSRKSMVHRLLGITPDEALNATTVLHVMALEKGAHILRVHDVRAAVEAIRIVGKVQQMENEEKEG
ncbi:MAG: dihydropteroate synthase [Prevotella sp.]|nr:dihydropteroate synthase [Prevotella sp.]